MYKNKLIFLFYIVVIIFQFIIGIFTLNNYTQLFIIFFILSFVSSLILIFLYLVVKKKFTNDVALLGLKIQKTNFSISTRNKIGIVLYDKKLRISWMSPYFQSIFNKKYVGKKINKSIISNEELMLLNAGKIINFKIEEQTFNIYKIKESNILIFTDISDIERLKKDNRDYSFVFCIINFSNYNEILNILGPTERAMFFVEIFQFLNNWCFKNNIIINNLSLNQQFLLIFNKKKLNSLIKNKKLEILLEKLVLLLKKNKFNSLISLGISYGISDPKILYDSTLEALKTAINRGGNQIVIHNYNKQENIYIGDSSEYVSVFKNTNLDLFVDQLRNAIPKFKNIFIATHIFPDYDGIAAALGLYYFCKQINIDVKIIIDFENVEEDFLHSIKNNIPNDDFNKIFISNLKKNQEKIDNSLLIIVDTSFRDRVKENILNKFNKIIVIDHHRSSEKFIDNIFLYFINPYKSSTSEIISEILFNKNNNFLGDIPKYVFNFLLTGIILDTNYFKQRIYSRTFYVVYELQKKGAEFDFASSIMSDNFELFNKKNYFLSKLKKIIDNIYVITSEDNVGYDRSLLAKVAQDAITIKGVKTCFVISMDKKMNTIMSCRSNDKNMNLQKITEKLGGGGHFSSAATQSKDIKIKEMKAKLLKILKNKKK